VLKANNTRTIEKIEMKLIFPLTLAAIVGTLLIAGPPLQAASADSRIESSAAKSYTFKTTPKEDSIKTVSKDGVVTLMGTVAETSHKALAEDTVASLPGVKSVDNQPVAVSSAQ
jgi:osmotically-inducible protein OsmY